MTDQVGAVSLAFSCDERDEILDVHHAEGDADVLARVVPGASFTALVDEGSVGKARRFLAAVRANGAASDWWLNMRLADRVAACFFVGGTNGGRLLIGAGQSSADALRAYALMGDARRLRGTVSVPAGDEEDGHRRITGVLNDLSTTVRRLTKESVATSPGAVVPGGGGFEVLTARETEVLVRLVRGDTNKQAAAALRISVKTIQKHREHIMKKMGTPTFADLVRRATLQGIL